MSQQIKQMMVAEMQQLLHSTKDIILLDVSRVDAVTMNRVRLDLASSHLRVLFVRNSMATRAVAMLTKDDKPVKFSGPAAIVFGDRDSTEMSKIIVQLATDNKNIKITAGVCEGQAVSTSDIDDLAKSPGREELLSIISGLLLSPGSTVSGLLTSVGSSLNGQLEQIKVSHNT